MTSRAWTHLVPDPTESGAGPLSTRPATLASSSHRSRSVTPVETDGGTDAVTPCPGWGDQAESFQLTIVTDVPTCGPPPTALSSKVTWAVRSLAVHVGTGSTPQAWNSTVRPPVGAVAVPIVHSTQMVEPSIVSGWVLGAHGAHVPRAKLAPE